MDAQIRLDGAYYVIMTDAGTLDELRARLQSAMVRGDVEQLWLAGGSRMTVNWRAVGTVHVVAETGSPPGG